MHGCSLRFLIYLWEIHGSLIGNMKVRVHDKRSRGSYSRRTPHRLCQGWTGRLCLGTGLLHFMSGYKLKAVNLKISAYPAPKAMVYVADAAAIKVRPLLFYVFDALDIGS